MLTKIKIGIVFVVLASLISTGFWVTQTSEISYGNADFVNVTDDRELIGAVHNVFFGKVIAQTGNKINTVPAGKAGGFSPQTQFSVEVLENVKGNLNGMITVNQYGGYKEEGNVNRLVLIEGDKPLEPGKTYLFATRFNNIDGWHTLVSTYGDLPITDQTDYQNKKERFKKAFEQEIPIKEKK